MWTFGQADNFMFSRILNLKHLKRSVFIISWLKFFIYFLYDYIGNGGDRGRETR